MFDIRAADRVTRFIELLKLTGDFYGQPFQLMDWQRKIVRDVYGTLLPRGVRQYRYVYVETAKKNAKSQLGSAVGLKHLYDKTEPHGQIVLCAGDREQARVDIYEPLVAMIEQDEELRARVKIRDSLREIENRETGTLLKVVSAEAYTKHGWNISCCIFDELHVQPNRALYDTMIKGAGLARRQPIWWFLTTSGDDPDRVSICWEVHSKAEAVLKARAAGDTAKDIPTWYPVIYAYNGEDIWNEANWYAANPSLDISLRIEDLRDLAKEAKLAPEDERLFRWLHLSQWPTTKLTSWLPLDLFDATVGTWTRKDMAGEDCYLGGDFSTTTDLSAICLIFPPQREHDDWRVCWDCWIPEQDMQARIKEDRVPYDKWAQDGWIMPTEGDMIDYTSIEEHILELKAQFNIKEMGSDRSFAAMLLQRLTQTGIACVDVPQRVAELTDPMNEIEIQLRSKKVTHENNPLVRWAFGNTSIFVNGNHQKKYVKQHHGKTELRAKRIDPIAAWVCGMARAKFYEAGSGPSVYEDRGILKL
jgi:phage terminase large subunit-like protein